MQIKILIFLLVFLLISQQTTSKRTQDTNQQANNNDITTLTFLIEYQPKNNHDHLQIDLTVQSKDRSLKQALNKVQDIVSKVQNVAQNFCKDNRKDQLNCQDVVDIQDFQIQAQYTKRRKDLIFQQFSVTHSVTIDVHQTDKIGQLADKLLKTDVSKINSFNWESDEQDDSQQQAIQAGKQKSEDMCFHLGMKLHRIVSIQAIEQDENQDDDQDGQQQEETDDEDNSLVYKFKVQCIKDAETQQKKRKEQEEQDQKQALEEEQQKRKEREQQLKEQERKAKEKKKKK